MSNKYVFNCNTGTLHIRGKCRHSKNIYDVEIYDSESDAISEQTKYMKKCKLCFKRSE